MEERRDGVMNTLTHMRSRATDSWTSASCVLHRKQRFHVSFADRSLEGMKKAMHSFVSTAHRLNENSVDVVQSDLPFFFSLSPPPRDRIGPLRKNQTINEKPSVSLSAELFGEENKPRATIHCVSTVGACFFIYIFFYFIFYFFCFSDTI